MKRLDWKNILLRSTGLRLPYVKNRERAYEIAKDMFFFLLGSALYSVSVAVFTAPNKIAPGGLTGIATILYYIIHTPVGTTMFVLNIPLFVLGFRHIGVKFIGRTVICTAMVSVMTDMMSVLPAYRSNLLLAVLYGGVLSGAGLGLIFLRGATTGGSDVASRLLRIRFPHIPMGRMMLLLDMAIIGVSAIVFRSLDSALYAIICSFTSSRVIDSILYGADTGRMALVISDQNDAIARQVLDHMERGVTLLKGKGVYTGRERDVLMCAVRRPEAAKLRNIIRQTDPAAFVIMCEAGEVIGEGFTPITKDM